MMEAPVAENLSLVAVRDFGRGPLALIDREAHVAGDRAGEARARHPGRRTSPASR